MGLFLVKFMYGILAKSVEVDEALPVEVVETLSKVLKCRGPFKDACVLLTTYSK